MEIFFGIKAIKAMEITRGDYNKYRGWDMPDDEDADEVGMLVEYPADPDNKPNHPDHEGYISWCPKVVFDKHHRSNGELTFGDALHALEHGQRVARKGWNGKGMFLFLLPADDNIPTKAIHDPALRKVIEAEVGGETFSALGSIRMFTADKKILTGWLASQTDMLSKDWEILTD
jgi:hypothetical protein